MTESGDALNDRRKNPSYGGGEFVGAKDEFIDLTRVALLLFQQKWLIIGCVFGFLAVALVFCIFAEKTYSASSMIELHSRRPRIVGDEGAFSGEDYSSSSMIADGLNTHFHKMQTVTVRARAVEELMKNPAALLDLQGMAEEELGGFLAKNVSFIRIEGTYLVAIVAQSENPAIAQLVANAYAAATIDVVKHSTKRASQEAVNWLQEQIESDERDLLKSEAKLIGFGRKHNIDGLNSSKITAAESLLTINDELVKYETQATIFKDMVRKLNEVKASPESAGVLPSTMPRAEILQGRLKDYTDAISTLSTLTLRYTNKHPSVERQREIIAAARQDIVNEIERAKATAESNLALVNAYVKSIRSNKVQQIAYQEEVLQKIYEYDTEVLPLQRELEASSISYKGLLDRIEEAKLVADQDTSLVTIYERASLPTDPVKPKKKLIVVIAGILGLGLGVFGAFVRHVFKNAVSSPHDIEVELKQNLLALIPHVEGGLDTPQMAKMGLSDKSGVFTESLAGLRSALLAQGHKRKDEGWVILVTSVSPKEGKTTISSNLAISMSRTYQRILVIDGDLRRPQHHIVHGVPEKGRVLMDVLMQNSVEAERIASTPQRTEIKNLHVAVGRPVEGVSPAEVLETGHFESFVQWARANYDIIIIDSPPLGVASDALVYGRLADDVVLVARFNKSRKGGLKQAIKDFGKNRCPLIGVVVNDYKPDLITGKLSYGSYRGEYYTPYSHDYMQDGREEKRRGLRMKLGGRKGP